MKLFLLAPSAIIALSIQSMAATVFYIGIDNNSVSEFEQEGGGRNDNKYYWHVGNYTTVAAKGGGFGENWLGDSTNPAGATTYERWSDGTGTSTSLGFARAITSSFTTHNIFFQLTADQVGAGKSLVFNIDLFGPGQAEGLTESAMM